MIAFTRKEGRTPHLVHGHYADAGYVAMEVAGAFGAPFVFTGHSLGRDKHAYLVEEGRSEESIEREFNMARRLHAEESCLAAADFVVVSTRHERDHQYARYDNGKAPQFQVIPPGTALDRFFPYYEYEISAESVSRQFKQARMRMAHELERFHFETNKPLILALCRPDKRKNIHTLVEAYGEDKELQAMANLAIFAGIRKNIAEMSESEQQVLTDILLMMDRYDLYGHMAIPKRHDSELEVPELYRLAASHRGIFVNPAFVEPFGLTFIESSAVGLPFVGTENGGPQDIRENCESGLLVNVSNREELTGAMKKLLTDRALWDEYSMNGVNRVREHYTWKKHCKLYLKALSELEKKPAHLVPAAEAPGSAYGKRFTALKGLLVTDIDNTLLGDNETLAELRRYLAENRETLGFAVATGRYLESAQKILEKHGVWPADLLITSVGTEIYYGAEMVPDKGWASHLGAKWRRDRVVEALEPLDFIYMQTDERTQREYKVSYDLKEGYPPQDALPAVHHALAGSRVAYNLIFSHGAYIDIVPHRASKGKAVRYIASKWNIPLERIATAGDSGNDIDMLTGRTSGIVVANHAEELKELKDSSSRVYFAESEYAGGILEGLRHYDLTNAGLEVS
jgi:sucrose-phosphate synthase